MDKYQQFLFNNIRVSADMAKKTEVKNSSSYNSGNLYNYDTNFGAKDFSFRGGIISITQNDNYHVHEYNINIVHPVISEIWIIKKGKKVIGTNLEQFSRKVVIDFDHKSPSIFISFKDDLADAIEIPIEYIDADKKAWDEKVRKETAEELANIVNVKITKADSLVNILFRPINKNYIHCKVVLYYTYTFNGEKQYQLIGEFKSVENMFFIPITNLGHASYAICLKQYDKENKLIYESDKIVFQIT